MQGWLQPDARSTVHDSVAHHSRSGSSGKETGSMVFASTLGDLFCTSSTLLSDMRSPWLLPRNAFVSSLVLKLFISTKRTCV